MTDELDKIINDSDGKVPVERVNELSAKVRDASKQRDDALEKAKANELEAANAGKERDFYKDFSKVSATYGNASEYEEDIKTKVLSGYSVEDATVSVLAKNGKLNMTPVRDNTNAGGSATNPPNKGGEKTVGEMSMSEKRQALIDAESRGEFTFS
jgi:hypothetical protein